MDEKYNNARIQFFAAVRALAVSNDSIQTRLISATERILLVTIDEFDGDPELKIKFARILDLLAADQDDLKSVAVETAAHMSDSEAVDVADLICDFFYELGLKTSNHPDCTQGEFRRAFGRVPASLPWRLN